MATRRSPGAVSATIPTLIPIDSERIMPDRTQPARHAYTGLHLRPSVAYSKSEVLKKNRSSDCGRLRRVRAVNAIALDIGGEPLADGALGRIGRVGGAHDFAQTS